jgi:eukaryotic-like serine/threonine-protein kinase
MSAQPDNETAAAPNWPGWLNASINGAYPLRRLLSGSEHGAVFLTEYKGRADPNAAIKIIPIERVTLAQLSHWKSATGLIHSHLIQLFDAGLCHLGGHQFLFVVMEYAEQTLSEVLRQRALTPDEVRELLPPTLDALTFLHSQGFVHGHLKPANVLVVDDQLKLSSDGIRPAGGPRVGIAEPSLYDPPEADHASFASAGDIWGLGMTLVEALTQSLPRFDEQSIAASLPTTVSPALVDTVQRCLSSDPALRPSAADLEAQFAGALQAPLAPVPQPVMREAPQRVTPTRESATRRGLMPRIAAIVGVILLAAVWAGWQLSRTHPHSIASQPPAVAPAITPPNPTAPLPEPPAAAVPSVTHVQLPAVPRKALGTIHGHFTIVALVVVDHSGTVIRGFLKNTGPSPYFARLTKEAAKQWTFSTTDGPGTHEWLLHFRFTRSGVTGEATPGS